MPNIVAQKAQTTPPTVARSPIDELVPKTEKCTVEIANIVLEDGMQMRASLCVDIVEEYAELIMAGKTFPPVVIYRLPSGELLLASGFHRVAAYKRAGKAEIPAIIQDGSRRDAVRHAIGSNSQHGLRMSHQDKRRAVKAALREFPELSDHKIADLVGVTQPFVSRLKRHPITVITAKAAQTPLDGDAAGENTMTAPSHERPEPAVGSPPPATPSASVASDRPQPILSSTSLVLQETIITIIMERLETAGLGGTQLMQLVKTYARQLHLQAAPEYCVWNGCQNWHQLSTILQLLESIKALRGSKTGAASDTHLLDAMIAQVKSIASR